MLVSFHGAANQVGYLQQKCIQRARLPNGVPLIAGRVFEKHHGQDAAALQEHDLAGLILTAWKSLFVAFALWNMDFTSAILQVSVLLSKVCPTKPSDLLLSCNA